ITLEAWNKTLQLNLTSVMLSNKNAIQSFLEYKNAGSILNLGSVLGYSPAPHHFATHAYATAKAAIIGLTKSTAAFYASHNIRVNVLAPGLIETPMSQRSLTDEAIMNYIKTKQPLQNGRMGRPEDLDKAACFFLSDYSAFTTGQVMAIDGGWGISEGQIFNQIGT
ncbi:MAG: SDR family oxidoreductase, partial [Cyclobacteriaceae bacterium]